MSKINYPILGYAPGHYSNKCTTCGENFMGDKYAVQCEPCAINTLNEGNKIAITKLHRIEQSLKQLVLNTDAINDIIKELN